jgi:cell fate (sporulation/competence/biofilm development) regulator YlbF (YheA/YmcA/DUF963 family)
MDYDDKVLKKIQENWNQMDEAPEEEPVTQSRKLKDMSDDEIREILSQYMETKNKLENKLERINKVISKLESSLSD